MQEIFLAFDISKIFYLFCGVFLIYFLLLRKQIYYWFDPLLVFLFFNSISIALVIYLYFFQQSIKQAYFIGFLLSILAFALGILYGGKKGLPKWKVQATVFDNRKIKNYSVFVDVFMLICLVIMVGSNLLMLAVKGTLPIFSSDPSQAKVLLYTGGWGIVKRINFALVNFVLAIPLIKIFHPTIRIKPKKKMVYFCCLLTAVIVMISMGSKSSLLILLNMIFAIVLLNRTSNTPLNFNFISWHNVKQLLKYAKYAFFGSVAMIFLVILLSTVGETSSSVFDAILTRLVASGDLFYFFYVYDVGPMFHKTPFDYLPHILNPILGMFRLTDYEFSVGIYTIYYAIGLPMDSSAAFGPNTQHPVEGLVYFGKYGAPVYSFFVGYIISAVRIGLLRKIGPFPNYIFLVIYIILSSLVLTAGTDVPLFLQIFYDELIYGGIIFFISLTVLPFVLKK